MVLDNTYSQPSLDYMRRWRMQPDTSGKHQEWRQQHKDGRKHWIEDVQKRALNESANHMSWLLDGEAQLRFCIGGSLRLADNHTARKVRDGRDEGGSTCPCADDADSLTHIAHAARCASEVASLPQERLWKDPTALNRVRLALCCKSQRAHDCALMQHHYRRDSPRSLPRHASSLPFLSPSMVKTLTQVGLLQRGQDSYSRVAYRPFPEQIMTAPGAATSGR